MFVCWVLTPRALLRWYIPVSSHVITQNINIDFLITIERKELSIRRLHQLPIFDEIRKGLNFYNYSCMLECVKGMSLGQKISRLIF